MARPTAREAQLKKDRELIANTEAAEREAELQAQELAAARARVEADEAEQARVDAAKARLESWITRVNKVSWTNTDADALTNFYAARDKQSELRNLRSESLMFGFVDYVPVEYAQTLRTLAAEDKTKGDINPANLFSLVANAIEQKAGANNEQ